MSAMTPQITGVSSVYLTVCSGADQRKHQSPASLAFVRGIHPWPVTRKIFPFDDDIMKTKRKPTMCITLMMYKSYPNAVGPMQSNLETLYDIVDTLSVSKHYWINTLGSVDHHHNEYNVGGCAYDL